MTKRMLIDATHAEETRVVVLDGNLLEDFDVESQNRRQLKGNIYLAKVVRVEPSLQAAFVEYGGNRHGFLAFGEIHPDYYQIPVADRQRLLAMQEEEARAEAEADEAEAYESSTYEQGAEGNNESTHPTGERGAARHFNAGEAEDGYESASEPATEGGRDGENAPDSPAQPLQIAIAEFHGEILAPDTMQGTPGVFTHEFNFGTDSVAENVSDNPTELTFENGDDSHQLGSRVQEVPMQLLPPPETVGGESDGGEEQMRERRSPPRFLRNYKIQEVIRRRQVMLIQVVKEERGSKGAALTTYISLAGRYSVLMPNSPRGGGISRKITSASDRRRLKEITAELEIPRGMGLIVRTAGANRPKPEIKRDCEYLLRLWDEIRDLTMRSVAPALIYEEASLIKRVIRDVYSRDVDEIIIDGEEAWKAARDFMRMLMPTHVKKIQLWRGDGQKLFTRSQVEAQLDAMLNPTVQLRSGGYLVINQTEALVAIDVNSGRATRERGIEETAVRTNLEAAEEVARQLRLRDLAGLIVIDFIDMESKRNNAAVERRLKDALKNDRARIQVGHISHFGLMEMSRQRLRPSIAETSMNLCVHCGGTGHVRSTEGSALHILRAIEEEGSKRRAAEILVHVNDVTALYILNNKRDQVASLEERFGLHIAFATDDTLRPDQSRIEKLRAAAPPEATHTISAERRDDYPAAPTAMIASDDATEEDDTESLENDEDVDAESNVAAGHDVDAAEAEGRRRRRRRRRRGGRREDGPPSEEPAFGLSEQPDITDAAFPVLKDASLAPANEAPASAAEPESDSGIPEDREREGGRPRRRRGGRRNRPPLPGENAIEPDEVAPVMAASPVRPSYQGPTPADPFANSDLDIFAVLEQAEVLESRKFSSPPAVVVQQDIFEDTAPAAAPATAIELAPVEIGETAAQAKPAEAEKPAATAIQPVLVDQLQPNAERKRGWWRK